MENTNGIFRILLQVTPHLRRKGIARLVEQRVPDNEHQLTSGDFRSIRGQSDLTLWDKTKFNLESQRIQIKH